VGEAEKNCNGGGRREGEFSDLHLQKRYNGVQKGKEGPGPAGGEYRKFKGYRESSLEKRRIALTAREEGNKKKKALKE